MASRGDAAGDFLDLDALHLSPGEFAGYSTVVLEGLDAVPEPVGLLRLLRASAPNARVLALVANAAHTGALGAFFSGEVLARAHPLVRSELEGLFAAGGWRTLAVNPWPASAAEGAVAFPVRVTTPRLDFDLADAAMFARLAPQAFIVVAEPV